MPGPGTSNSIVLAAISRLEEKIDKLDCRIQELEKADVSNDNVAETVKDHEKRIREIEKLAPGIRLLFWLFGILGASVIGFIWLLITGQASIIFVK
jgi:hypothetical protein